MCIGILPACMYSEFPEEGVESSGIGVNRQLLVSVCVLRTEPRSFFLMDI